MQSRAAATLRVRGGMQAGGMGAADGDDGYATDGADEVLPVYANRGRWDYASRLLTPMSSSYTSRLPCSSSFEPCARASFRSKYSSPVVGG